MNNINQFQAIIEDAIGSLNFGVNPPNLYDPIRYIMRLGGKRIRPLLALLSYKLFSDGDLKSVIRPAIALETFHNFTLLHDDIMDKAPLRRGKPTVHEKWNANTAILSGDVMLVRVHDLFLDLPPLILRRVIKKFNDCAAQVCEGQQLDMNYETTATVDEDTYIEMIKLKTAALIGFSLEMGAMIAEASEINCNRMREFGSNIGIGFQLKDDLLDVYADQSKFGKQVGGDIIANKKTFLLIKAKELARGPLLKELEYWTGLQAFDSDQKVEAVTRIYNELDLKEITSQKINTYFEMGFHAFKTIGAPDDKKDILNTYIRNLIHREK